MLPTSIFFDLDDTIISYDAGAAPLWQAVCEAYCRETGALDVQRVFEAVIRVSKWYWSDKERHRLGRLNLAAARRQIVTSAFRELGNNDFDGASQIADAFSARRNESIMIFPGAAETLHALRQQGIRLALLTNGAAQEQNAKIDRFHLRPYFETILVEGEVGFGKPEAQIYQLALARLQVSPEVVWMVGDNLEWDVAGPQALGIYGIWHDWRKKGLPENCNVTPDRIIHQISELQEIL
jgi:putative hydrolase of the HAD superfamily